MGWTGIATTVAVTTTAALTLTPMTLAPEHRAAVPAGATSVSAPLTVSGDAAFRITTTRTADGRVLTLRWDPCQAAVTYKVNARLAGSSATARSAAVADVATAFDRVARATGIRFRYAGTTDVIPNGAGWENRTDGVEIVVAWVDQRHASTASRLLGTDARGGEVAATGGYSYRTWSTGGPWSGVIGRGFVVINARQQSSFRPGFGPGVTRGDLLLHELGHVVGLAHVTDTGELMYPVILDRRSSAYRAGDLAGLRRVGRQAGCVSVPTWVWTDL